MILLTTIITSASSYPCPRFNQVCRRCAREGVKGHSLSHCAPLNAPGPITEGTTERPDSVIRKQQIRLFAARSGGNHCSESHQTIAQYENMPGTQPRSTAQKGVLRLSREVFGYKTAVFQSPLSFCTVQLCIRK